MYKVGDIIRKGDHTLTITGITPRKYIVTEERGCLGAVNALKWRSNVYRLVNKFGYKHEPKLEKRGFWSKLFKR